MIGSSQKPYFHIFSMCNIYLFTLINKNISKALYSLHICNHSLNSSIQGLEYPKAKTF